VNYSSPHRRVKINRDDGAFTGCLIDIHRVHNPTVAPTWLNAIAITPRGMPALPSPLTQNLSSCHLLTGHGGPPCSPYSMVSRCRPQCPGSSRQDDSARPFSYLHIPDKLIQQTQLTQNCTAGRPPNGALSWSRTLPRSQRGSHILLHCVCRCSTVPACLQPASLASVPGRAPVAHRAPSPPWQFVTRQGYRRRQGWSVQWFIGPRW
jgi:hypothetical protein